MPRARGDKEYILPNKGLNTDANLLHFPQEFTPDCLNMEVDYSPQLVRPRKGITTTGSPVLAETRNSNAHDIGISSFLWTAVNDDTSLNYVVVQVGRYIYFFDDSQLSNATTAANSKKIDINNLLSGTSLGTLVLAEPTRLEFANVKGNLLVCSPQIDPTIVQYNGTDFDVTALALKQRDLLGIEDGLRVDERPSSLSDDHKYNLNNQGWYKQRRNSAGSAVESDPITTFHTAFTVYPSNADIAYLGMVEDSGDLIFDPEWLRDQTFGATPAPRGHYIVDVFSIDRDDLNTNPLTGGGRTGGSYRRGDPGWSYEPLDEI